MPAYCLFQNIRITDDAKMQEYVEKVKPITESFGGKYVASGGSVDVMEGSWEPVWPVIIEFPTLKNAHDWYKSEVYRPLKELRESAGEFSAVFIEGFDGS